MGQQAPPVDDLGLRNLAIITPIFALGILLFLVRIYTRVVPTCKLNASDYMLSVAVVAEIITYSLFATAIDDGLGSPNYYLTPEVIVKISKLLFGLVFVGRWSASFARISVACLLLQFATSTGWKLILWATLCFQAATLLASELFHLLQCQPIQALWEEGPNRQCVHPKQAWIIGYLIVGIGIAGDLAVAIMPMFVIWRLSRHVVERCLITGLMGLGLVATGAGVMKVIHMNMTDFTSPDTFRQAMPVLLWCRIEEFILVVAASAPLLKAPIERVLHRLGFPTFQSTPRDLESFHSTSTRISKKRRWYAPWVWQEKEGRSAQGEQGCNHVGRFEAGDCNLMHTDQSC